MHKKFIQGLNSPVESKTRKLIPVSDKNKLEENGVPFKASTLRKWHHLGLHAEIFVKAAGKLCIDLIKFWKWIDEIVAEKERKTQKYNERLGI